jgi:hypothetical protein
VPQGFWCIRLDWQGCGVLSHARFSPCPTVPVETPGPGLGPRGEEACAGEDFTWPLKSSNVQGTSAKVP